MASELQCIYAPEFAEVLSKLGLSLAVSTLDEGRVVLLRPKEPGISILSRHLPRPMGIVAENANFTIAHRCAVTQYRFINHLSSLEAPWNTHDIALQKAVTWHVGQADPHEVVNTSSGLVFVNTRFSCLAKPSLMHAFSVEWKPPFISDIAPEDRCHLNGVCVAQGEVIFATALGCGDEAESWRNNIEHGGVLIDVKNNSIAVEGLNCPHSPRWWNGEILFLESGRGKVLAYCPVKKACREVANINGFARGLAVRDSHAFIGVSRLRDSDQAFSRQKSENNLQVRDVSGILCIDLPTGDEIGTLEFKTGAREVFDIQILNGYQNPYITREDSSKYGELFILKNTSFLVEYNS